MTTEHDPRSRIVLSWLREDAHENAERVLLRALNEVDATPQRRSWWPARRDFRMNSYARLIAAVAAVLVVAIGGYQFLPGGSGSGRTDAAPSPSPVLLARGNFVTSRGAVELEAIARGSSVTGRMIVSPGDRPFTVDLQCTRTTEDGLLMIGGLITDSTRPSPPVGTWAAIWLKRGSPVQAEVWFLRGGQPIAYAPSCLAGLDAQLEWELSGSKADPPDYNLQPIEGTVELGP